MPAAAERLSGTLERKTATTNTKPTAPPPMRLIPMAADYGMPSMSAAIVIAVADPSACWPWERLRCRPPAWSTTQLVAK